MSVISPNTFTRKFVIPVDGISPERARKLLRGLMKNYKSDEELRKLRLIDRQTKIEKIKGIIDE